MLFRSSPDRTATNTTTSALTFTNLATLGSAARFTGDARAKVSGEYKPATIVHALSGTGNGVLVYENDGGTALTIQTFTDFYPSLTKTVDLITVTNAGSGYTTTPTVTFTGGSGSGASATARLTNQAVVGITVDSGGTGYATAPIIGFSNGGGGSGATAEATLVQIGVTGKLPRHNVACMWGDILVLADIQWSEANATTGLNSGKIGRAHV